MLSDALVGERKTQPKQHKTDPPAVKSLIKIHKYLLYLSFVPLESGFTKDRIIFTKPLLRSIVTNSSEHCTSTRYLGELDTTTNFHSHSQ